MSGHEAGTTDDKFLEIIAEQYPDKVGGVQTTIREDAVPLELAADVRANGRRIGLHSGTKALRQPRRNRRAGPIFALAGVATAPFVVFSALFTMSDQSADGAVATSIIRTSGPDTTAHELKNIICDAALDLAQTNNLPTQPAYEQCTVAGNAALLLLGMTPSLNHPENARVLPGAVSLSIVSTTTDESAVTVQSSTNYSLVVTEIP